MYLGTQRGRAACTTTSTRCAPPSAHARRLALLWVAGTEVTPLDGSFSSSYSYGCFMKQREVWYNGTLGLSSFAFLRGVRPNRSIDRPPRSHPALPPISFALREVAKLRGCFRYVHCPYVGLTACCECRCEYAKLGSFLPPHSIPLDGIAHRRPRIRCTVQAEVQLGRSLWTATSSRSPARLRPRRIGCRAAMRMSTKAIMSGYCRSGSTKIRSFEGSIISSSRRASSSGEKMRRRTQGHHRCIRSNSSKIPWTQSYQARELYGGEIREAESDRSFPSLRSLIKTNPASASNTLRSMQLRTRKRMV